MRAISHIVPAALRELLRAAPLSDGKVNFAWKTAVGPALERATAVKLEAGTLIVETPDRSGRGSEALERRHPCSYQDALGDGTVQRIEVRPR
jgi:hypothetical protein